MPERNHYLDKVGMIPLVPVQLDADGPTIWCKLEFLNPERLDQGPDRQLHPG